MPRTRRLDYPGAKHHLMCRGARRAPVFHVPGARAIFLELLAELPARFGLAVHAYALMGNHYHLLVTSPEGGLAGPMQRLDQTFTQRLNSLHAWDGPVFRGRYTDVLVCEPAHWSWLLAYVHLNPERAGMPERVSDPLWTSHPAYLGHHRLRRWLDVREHLDAHGNEQGYAEWLAAVSGGRVAAPEGFLPETPVTGMRVVPVPQVSRDPRQLLAMLEGVAGRSIPRGQSRDPLALVAAWWLGFNGVRQIDSAALLRVERTAMTRRSARLLALVDDDPLVASWMAALSGIDPRSAVPRSRTAA